jgi:hypothetical protein
VAACLATSKWSGNSMTPPGLRVILSFHTPYKWSAFPLHRLFEHWLRCYDLFTEDKKYLRQVYELTYEEYIENQNRHHQQIARFIGAGPPVDVEPATDSYNKKYLDRWHKMLTSGLGRKYCQFIAAKYEPLFARHNYSLFAEMEDGEKLRREGAAIPPALGAFYCACAQIAALVRGWTDACRCFLSRKLGRKGDDVMRFQRQGEASEGRREKVQGVEQMCKPSEASKT